jgi:hypothetical protein
MGIRDSPFGVAVDWKARVRYLSLLHSVQTSSVVNQRPIQWVPGSLSSEVKLPGLEADHSSPPSADVKKSGAIPPFSYMSSWRDP